MSPVLSLSPIVYLIGGGVVLSVTVWLFHWLRVRRFSRLNAVGVETFKSYNHMTMVRAGESLMRGLAAVGLLGGCLLVGVGLFKML